MDFDPKYNIFLPLLIFVGKKDVVKGRFEYTGKNFHFRFVLIVPYGIPSRREPLGADILVSLFLEFINKLIGIPQIHMFCEEHLFFLIFTKILFEDVLLEEGALFIGIGE